MAEVKAPNIPRPAAKQYRTTEDYISGFTRHCSNELDSHMAPPPVYAPWLTPDHARSVAVIARENTIRQAVRWLRANIDHYTDTVFAMDDSFYEDFRKAMEEIEV